YGKIKGRYTAQRTIGSVDIQQWGKANQQLLPKEYERAMIVTWQGTIAADSFWVSADTSTLTKYGAKMSTSLRDGLLTLVRTSIAPQLKHMLGTLFVTLEDLSREMLSSRREDELVEKYLYTKLGR